MNQKNSLELDNCFKDLENPIELFNEWFNEAKKTEINDPNALALATSSKDGAPSVRIVLLKSFNQNGFVIYTNLDSKKSIDIKKNPNAEMCFHWKSLLRQIRITGEITKVSDEDADWCVGKNEVKNFVDRYQATFGEIPSLWGLESWCSSGGCSSGDCGTCSGSCGNDCSSM